MQLNLRSRETYTKWLPFPWNIAKALSFVKGWQMEGTFLWPSQNPVQRYWKGQGRSTEGPCSSPDLHKGLWKAPTLPTCMDVCNNVFVCICIYVCVYKGIGWEWGQWEWSLNGIVSMPFGRKCL